MRSRQEPEPHTLKKPVYTARIVVPEWDIDIPGKFEPLVTRAVFDAEMVLTKLIEPLESRSTRA